MLRITAAEKNPIQLLILLSFLGTHSHILFLLSFFSSGGFFIFLFE